jgi:hypothetical protein
MPLAIRPKKETARVCLVNCGDDRLKVAYYKMFVGGQDGVIEMLQTGILEYGEVLKKAHLPAKEQLRAIEKFNTMLGRLHKMMEDARRRPKDGKGAQKEEDEEMDEVILIASKNDAKPDPESLADSPMLDDLIKHDEPPEKKEVDVGKELLDKFFPQDEK